MQTLKKNTLFFTICFVLFGSITAQRTPSIINYTEKTLQEDVLLHLMLKALIDDAMASGNIDTADSIELRVKMFDRQSSAVLDADAKKWFNGQAVRYSEIAVLLRKLYSQVNASENARNFASALNQFGDPSSNFANDLVDDYLSVREAAAFYEYDSNLKKINDKYVPGLILIYNKIAAKYGFKADGQASDDPVLVELFTPKSSDRRREIIRDDYLSKIPGDIATWDYFRDDVWANRRRLVGEKFSPELAEAFGKIAKLPGELPLVKKNIYVIMTSEFASQLFNYAATTSRQRKLDEANRTYKNTLEIRNMINQEVVLLEKFKDFLNAQINELGMAGVFTPRISILSFFNLDLGQKPDQEKLPFTTFSTLLEYHVIWERKDLLGYIDGELVIIDNSRKKLLEDLGQTSEPPKSDVPEINRPEPKIKPIGTRPPIIKKGRN